MSATVKYKGNTLVTVENQIKTLKTAGKYLEDDVIIEDVSGGGVGLIPFAIRGDAELVKSWHADELFVADHGGTIPAYSTTAATLITGAALESVSVSVTSYSYFLVERCLTIPIYADNTARKGRGEFTLSVFPYELIRIDASAVAMRSNPSKMLGSSSALIAMGSLTRMAYWSSTSAVGWYTATTYGVAQTVAAPTYASSALTINSPNLIIRGSTTYMTSAAWARLTDIRRQYIIELYRVPIEQDIRGWILGSTMERLVRDVAENDGTLR